MSKKLKQTMFLINMMTLKKRRSWEWRVDTPLGKELRKLPGNSSNVCYRTVGTKAKAAQFTASYGNL